MEGHWYKFKNYYVHVLHNSILECGIVYPGTKITCRMHPYRLDPKRGTYVKCTGIDVTEWKHLTEQNMTAIF